MFFCKLSVLFHLALTNLDPEPSAPEAAVQRPLRAVWLLLMEVSSNLAQTASHPTPSFLSDDPPRDRRGGIGEKSNNIQTSLGDPGSSARRRPIPGRRNVNGDLGCHDYVPGEGEFSDEETVGAKKGGRVGVIF